MKSEWIAEHIRNLDITLIPSYTLWYNDVIDVLKCFDAYICLLLFIFIDLTQAKNPGYRLNFNASRYFPLLTIIAHFIIYW